MSIFARLLCRGSAPWWLECVTSQGELSRQNTNASIWQLLSKYLCEIGPSSVGLNNHNNNNTNHKRTAWLLDDFLNLDLSLWMGSGPPTNCNIKGWISMLKRSPWFSEACDLYPSCRLRRTLRRFVAMGGPQHPPKKGQWVFLHMTCDLEWTH